MSIENFSSIIEALVYFGINDIVNLNSENFDLIVAKHKKDIDFDKNYNTVKNLMNKNSLERATYFVGKYENYDVSRRKIYAKFNEINKVKNYSMDIFENIISPAINVAVTTVENEKNRINNRSYKTSEDFIEMLIEKNPGIKFYHKEGDIIGNTIITNYEFLNNIKLPEGFSMEGKTIVNNSNEIFEKRNFHIEYSKNKNYDELKQYIAQNNDITSISFDDEKQIIQLSKDMKLDLPKGLVIRNGSIINESNIEYSSDLSIKIDKILSKSQDSKVEENKKVLIENAQPDYKSDNFGARERGYGESDLDYVSYLKDFYHEKYNSIKKEEIIQKENIDSNSKKDELKAVEEVIKNPTDSKDKKEYLAIREPDQKRIKIQPKKIKTDKKIRKSTIAAILSGVAVGTGVHFLATSMPGAGAFIKTGYMLGAHFIERKIKVKKDKLKEQRLSGENVITDVSLPTPEELSKIAKIKQYFNSEQGLDDISKMLNTSMITLTALSLTEAISNFVNPEGSLGIDNNSSVLESDTNVVGTENTTSSDFLGSENGSVPESLGDNNILEGTSNDMSSLENETPFDFEIGGDLDGANLEHGNDVASDAFKGINTENLMGEYINADASTISEIRIFDDNGTLLDIVRESGASASELAEQYGVPLDNMVANVVRAEDGAAQAWVSLRDLMGGMSR